MRVRVCACACVCICVCGSVDISSWRRLNPEVGLPGMLSSILYRIVYKSIVHNNREGYILLPQSLGMFVHSFHSCCTVSALVLSLEFTQ